MVSEDKLTTRVGEVEGNGPVFSTPYGGFVNRFKFHVQGQDEPLEFERDYGSIPGVVESISEKYGVDVDFDVYQAGGDHDRASEDVPGTVIEATVNDPESYLSGELTMMVPETREECFGGLKTKVQYDPDDLDPQKLSGRKDSRRWSLSADHQAYYTNRGETLQDVFRSKIDDLADEITSDKIIRDYYNMVIGNSHGIRTSESISNPAGKMIKSASQRLKFDHWNYPDNEEKARKDYEEAVEAQEGDTEFAEATDRWREIGEMLSDGCVNIEEVDELMDYLELLNKSILEIESVPPDRAFQSS